jgi:hypothetical protein
MIIWLAYHFVPWEFVWEIFKSYILGPVASCIKFIFGVLFGYVNANARSISFAFAVIWISYRVTSWAVAWGLAGDEDEEEEEKRK